VPRHSVKRAAMISSLPEGAGALFGSSGFLFDIGVSFFRRKPLSEMCHYLLPPKLALASRNAVGKLKLFA